jgi:hypothetical protein
VGEAEDIGGAWKVRFSKENLGEPYPLQYAVKNGLRSYGIGLLLLGFASAVVFLGVATLVFVLMGRLQPLDAAFRLLGKNWGWLAIAVNAIVMPMAYTQFGVEYDETESFQEMIGRRFAAIEERLDSLKS